MIYIEAPNKLEHIISYVEMGYFNIDTLFLAGGITDCPNWQKEMLEMLSDTTLTILNPRRENFPIHDAGAALKQITWEHYALRFASEILFWFPKETICPIVLYELGAWSRGRKKLYVGVHPEYKRKQDVQIQTRLARPEIEIVYSLEALSSEVHI